MKLFHALFLAGATMVATFSAHAETDAPVKLGFAKCAHCVSMGLVPDLATGVKIEAINFNSGNDVLTALVSKSIDVAQVTYLHYVTALDKGFDVVAISGQVNGGSELLLPNASPIAADDWTGLKAAIFKAKTDGKPFRVGASRGNAQDIHMRGMFLKNGIDPNKDIQFINIPNPADHLSALQRGEIDMIATVEPFASQILQAGAGKHFDYPYDQAAGKLTNLIVTRSDVIKSRPAAVQASVTAVVKLVDMLKADQQVWIQAIGKYTGLDQKIAAAALKNAYPDYAMYRGSTQAIAKMMRDLNYISHDVSADIDKNMDYDFLSQATGKPKSELGY
ncbi:ABC transporter substrate-binding protein [Telmatospirillum siberiense]|nr:ABC transporter substrate-binding protein [Telmatospirillum siberiense]